MRHRNEACAYACIFHDERFCAAASPHVSRMIIRHIGGGRVKCLRAKYFCAAAAAQGRGGGARSENHHALSRRHRQCRGGQECRSGCARAGLSAIDRLQGRYLRQARHHAVHDRARDLQAQARTGAGRRDRRAGVAEAGRRPITSGRSDLVQRQAVSQATLDTSTSTRDNAQANLQQAQANTKIAQVNYGYTNVTAPFDGIVTAHQVSVGELVGVSSPTQLATIVALDPIWVNFNVNEQDVQRFREEMRKRGMTPNDIRTAPDRGRPADRNRLPAQGNDRLRLADPQSVYRHHRGARHSARMPIARCCPASSSASACPLTSRRMRC